MKATTINKIYFILIVVLAFLLFTKSCKKETTLVEIPAVSGEMKPIVKDSISYKAILKKSKKNGKKVVTPDTIVDSELVAWLEDNLRIYKQASDSLQRENLYLKSIEPKFFTSHTTDENLDLTLTGYVSGTLHKITPTYTIKKKTIEIPKKNAFFVGGQIGHNKEFNSALFEANFLLKNKKDNIISIGYDTDNRFKLGYFHKIF